jgi:hypothetical protein
VLVFQSVLRSRAVLVRQWLLVSAAADRTAS